MKSAGNDIVALSRINKQRTAQFNFYSKILSASEHTLFHQPVFAKMPFEHYVWLVWSVKESAFKFLKRFIPDLVFSPIKIIVQCIKIPAAPSMAQFEGIERENTEEFYKGKVIYGDYIFYFRSKINEDWIATIVNDDEHFENVYWGVQLIDEAGYYHQAKAARTLLLNKLSSFLPGDFHLGKSLVGYPVILKGMQNMHIPVSLAHDDHFVAYSFLLNCGSNGNCN